MRSICWWCSSGLAACSGRSDGYELCPAPPPRSDRGRVPGGDRGAGAAVREGRLRPEHHGPDANVRGIVAELEHPQWLLRANLARACAVFRARRLHHRASLHQIRRAAVVRHARRRPDIGAHRDGAGLSMFPPARPLLRHRHHRHRRDRAAPVPELGLGRRRARHRYSDTRRQLAQVPVHTQQAALFLLRAGAGLYRLARDLVAGRFQVGLLVARGEGQSRRRRKPGRGRVQFQDGRRGGLRLPHRGRRQFLRAVRVLHRSGKRDGLSVLAADGVAGRARRHRHPVGAGARRRHPDSAHRTDAFLHRRLRPRCRPDCLWHADRADLAGAAGRVGRTVLAPAQGSGPMTLLLETRGVWQRFGGLIANSDISISVGRGEIVGLIGPNGAGKSTLFNLIAGVLPPTQGSIWFDGEDVTALPAAERCYRGVGRTFQVVKSFETMTVIDNVIVGALVRTTVMREARRKAHEVLEFTGLAARANVLASDLVPAEKRRLEVARALATEPKLLLLDEVLTGLTPTEAQTGVALVRKVRDAGITVLMVEHVMEIVMPLVDRAIVLDLGKVLVEGKPTEIVRDPKVISAYLGDRHAVGA